MCNCSTSKELEPLPPEGDPFWQQATHLIIANIPPGNFRSADCQPIIRQQWPDHPLAQLGPAEFGKHMAGRIWPIMEELGVAKKGHGYHMTTRARENTPSTPGPPAPEGC